MEEQIGWQGLVEQIKKEAPRYVHLLPQLPRLLHGALQPSAPAQQRALEALLVEQRRTNRLLTGIVYTGLGFLLGLVAMQIFIRLHSALPAPRRREIYTVGLSFPGSGAMPIYAYRCTTCGHSLDALRKISDPALTVCPACGQATLVKQVTAAGFQLKGSGWYVTDFRGDKKGRSSPRAQAGSAAATPPAEARRRGRQWQARRRRATAPRVNRPPRRRPRPPLPPRRP